MKKKILTAFVLCFSLMLTMILTGCGVAEVKSIEVVGNAYSEYTVGENYDYSNVRVHVTFQDGTEQTISASDPGVTVTGLDTSSATQNGKMTISYTDEKGNTVSCDLGYTVYTPNQTVAYAGDRSKVTDQTTADDEGILFFSRAGKYDLSDYPISRNLKIVARTGENVELQNVKINAKSDISVSFNNVTLTNNGKTNILDVVKNSNTANITVNRCKIKANGKDVYGVVVPNKGNVEINETDFITPNKNSDLFTYGVYIVTTDRDLSSSLKITKNTFDCNFQYLFFGFAKAEIIGNHIDSTLISTGLGEYTGSANGQTVFVARKNPVVIHYDPRVTNIRDGQKLTLVVKNNTVNGAQNFIRAYDMDNNRYDDLIDWEFSGNTLTNIAVLLNCSEGTVRNIQKLIDIIKADTNIKETCYVQEYKAVITKDTEIQVQKTGVYSEKVSATDAKIYYDLENGENSRWLPATMQINGNTYTYVGIATKMYGDVPSGHIILRDNKAYIITSVDYSPTGDSIHYASNSGTTTNIAEAKAFTIADLIEMIYGTID